MLGKEATAQKGNVISAVGMFIAIIVTAINIVNPFIVLGGILLGAFILSIYLGLELISKVPSTLHTPLMSGANAISGIALVGALTLTQDTFLQTVIAFLAITFASINVFGGYLVTNRMLSMFKKK